MTDLGKVVREYMAVMHFDPNKTDETLKNAGANKQTNKQTRNTNKQQQHQQSHDIAHNNQTMAIQRTQPNVPDLDEGASDLDEDDSDGEFVFA